ncbi:inactive leucine-rich repeat receptor-like protein kinase [Acorus gramineus]|uniref:Inactive leucine-rich repeat receptor-like protein kinase n=1 Tax=Acorus gramineus TaxID=55184 RepID=A0AAV9B8Z6_ACOGR|nr:inactive leucine-rich repeat receptor-like protein kinase [Acorus gramineus]
MSLTFLALHLLLLFLSPSPATSTTFPGDIEALKSLKSAIDPASITPGSCLSTWSFAAGDPCDNLFAGDLFTCGLRCDLSVSSFLRVTDISLDPAAYSGALSAALFGLPYLQSFDVSDNLLHGPIPNPTSASSLRRLALSSNAFSGEIPLSIGSISSLEELFLDNNRLSGPIPPSIANLRNLKRLEVQSNKLSGDLPDLNGLSGLYFFDASDNALSGPIADKLPTSLVQVAMRNNKFDGVLDGEATVRRLGFLQVLDLSHNALSGPVPSQLFDHPSLEQLTLSFNGFTALNPPRWSGATTSRLIAVDLGHNRIDGWLPGFMAAMPRLTAVSLEYNRFTGLIPYQYALRAVAAAMVGGGGVPFQRLVLAGNYLYGPIPVLLMGLKQGGLISLGDNCLFRCPRYLFFCQGGRQKSLQVCKDFNPVIP